jgi:ketosteroid isomerase-like protein
MSHEDALRRAYEQWNETKGADESEWLNLMSENIVFRSLAAGAEGMEFTRECHSKADVRGYFSGLSEGWQMIYYVPDVFIVQDDRVAVLARCSFRSKKTGKVIETPKADFFLFERGKIIEFMEFYDTEKAIAASKE